MPAPHCFLSAVVEHLEGLQLLELHHPVAVGVFTHVFSQHVVILFSGGHVGAQKATETFFEAKTFFPFLKDYFFSMVRSQFGKKGLLA